MEIADHVSIVHSDPRPPPNGSLKTVKYPDEWVQHHSAKVLNPQRAK